MSSSECCSSAAVSRRSCGCATAEVPHDCASVPMPTLLTPPPAPLPPLELPPLELPLAPCVGLLLPPAEHAATSASEAKVRQRALRWSKSEALTPAPLAPRRS